MANSFLTRAQPTISLFSNPRSILAIVSTAHAVNHAYSTLMPLIYPIVVREFLFTNAQIGLMVGVGNSVGGLLQLAYGSLRRLIARRFLLGGGLLIMALGAALTSIATTFNFFFATNFLARIGGSPQHPVGSSILSDAFEPKRRGFALAAHVSGGNVGTVAVPLIGTVLIVAFGWRASLFVFAAVAALVGMMIAFTLDESTSNHVPERTTTQGSREEIKKIFSNRNIQMIFLASVLAGGARGLIVLATWIPLYLQNGLGLDANYSGILFTLLLIGSVLGPILLGRVSDQYGRRPILLFAYIASMILTLIFTLLRGSDWWLPVILLAMGLAVYAESPLLQAFLADSTEGLDRDLTFALFFSIAFGVGAIWAFMIGLVIDAFGFTFGFQLMAASYILTALCVIPMREARSARPS